MSLIPHTLTPQQRDEMYQGLLYGYTRSINKPKKPVRKPARKPAKKPEALKAPPMKRKRKAVAMTSQPPKKKMKKIKKIIRGATSEGVSKKIHHSTSRHRRGNI